MPGAPAASRCGPASTSIPSPGQAAIPAGELLVYERKGAAGAEKLAGRARFAQLRVLGGDGSRRFSREFSYARAPAE